MPMSHAFNTLQAASTMVWKQLIHHHDCAGLDCSTQSQHIANRCMTQNTTRHTLLCWLGMIRTGCICSVYRKARKCKAHATTHMPAQLYTRSYSIRLHISANQEHICCRRVQLFPPSVLKHSACLACFRRVFNRPGCGMGNNKHQ